MAADLDLTLDHQQLDDTRATRRYFGKFARITGHLAAVAAEERAAGRLSAAEVEALARTLLSLALTFRALSHKYFWAGRAPQSEQTVLKPG